MKKIILKSLTMTNWRGEKQRTTNFNADVTTIMGDNGLGKSRHFDAFIWLLFGKDSADRKDFNIKSLDEHGNPIPKCECSVTGVLDIDGEELTIKRSYVENWVKPKGQTELVFKGNDTECTWNDAPVKVGEYKKRIESIIDESVFKMITNPAFFVNMPWKLQREQLFLLAGTVSDEEIAAKDESFAVLLEKISGKGFADFKRELQARKKRLKEELSGIQPRIDQTNKLMPAPENWDELQAELERIDTFIHAHDGDAAETTSQLNLLKLKQKMLDDNKRHLSSVRSSITSLQSEKTRLNTEITNLNTQKENLKIEFAKVVDTKFENNGICPFCGQPIPADKMDEARKAFEKEKDESLDKLDAKGESLNADIKAKKDRIAAIDIEIAEKNKNINDVEKANSGIEADITDIAAKIETLKSGISDDADNPANGKNMSLKEYRAHISARLAARDAITKYKQEVENLEKRGKELAQEIADAEREEYTIAQFTKTKIDECEKRINGLFKMVTFRLFTYTIDGNESETCEALVDGKPYGVANTAKQVNAGLDIINALCKYYGTCAPIFIDNRESVNNVIDTYAQIINLVVSHDKELVIK